MVTPWDQFIDSIEQKKKQIDDVLEAYRAFRQKLDALPPELARAAHEAMASGQSLSARGAHEVKKDLAGKTALECVMTILVENGNEPQHFSTIAKEALSRGYVGRLSGNKEEVETRTTTSFWSAMSRSDELENVGAGRYKLRMWPPGAKTAEDAVKSPKDKGRFEQLCEFLKQHGAVKRKVIVEESGIPEGTIGMLLKEGPESPFLKDIHGRWYLRSQVNKVSESVDS